MPGDTPGHDPLCAVVREFLATGQDAPLPAGDAGTLDRHLQACEGCRRLASEHRAAWDLLGKASLPRPPTSDAAFLAAVRSRIRSRAVLRASLALAAAAVLAAAGLAWFFRPVEDQAIIDNLAVLQDLQAAVPSPESSVEVEDTVHALITMLDQPAGDGSLDDELIDDLDEGLDEVGKKG